jgi:cysteine desulfurase / selenocysteine lyase
MLADALRERLTAQPGVQVHDQGNRRCGIVTFTVEGVQAQRVQQQASANRVNVSVSLVDHARLDLPARGLPDLVRASVHYYNSEDEIDRLIAALPSPAVTST